MIGQPQINGVVNLSWGNRSVCHDGLDPVAKNIVLKEIFQIPPNVEFVKYPKQDSKQDSDFWQEKGRTASQL